MVVICDEFTISLADGSMFATVICNGDCICPFGPYITGPWEYCTGVIAVVAIPVPAPLIVPVPVTVFE